MRCEAVLRWRAAKELNLVRLVLEACLDPDPQPVLLGYHLSGGDVCRCFVSSRSIRFGESTATGCRVAQTQRGPVPCTGSGPFGELSGERAYRPDSLMGAKT